MGSIWLNLASVQTALHVTAARVSNWAVCAGLDYTKTRDTVIPLYPALVNKYRTLVFSGDGDNCVPYIGTQEWVRNLGFPVKQNWHPWLVNDQVAGYAVNYQPNLTFATVKGAGHMVPQYMPEQALALFTAFINNTPL